jgi:hypothetical protein
MQMLGGAPQSASILGLAGDGYAAGDRLESRPPGLIHGAESRRRPPADFQPLVVTSPRDAWGVVLGHGDIRGGDMAACSAPSRPCRPDAIMGGFRAGRGDGGVGIRRREVHSLLAPPRLEAHLGIRLAGSGRRAGDVAHLSPDPAGHRIHGADRAQSRVPVISTGSALIRSAWWSCSGPSVMGVHFRGNTHAPIRMIRTSTELTFISAASVAR